MGQIWGSAGYLFMFRGGYGFCDFLNHLFQISDKVIIVVIKVEECYELEDLHSQLIGAQSLGGELWIKQVRVYVRACQILQDIDGFLYEFDFHELLSGKFMFRPFRVRIMFFFLCVSKFLFTNRHFLFYLDLSDILSRLLEIYPKQRIRISEGGRLQAKGLGR